MIFCFSATGNSSFVAHSLAETLHDRVEMLPIDTKSVNISEEDSIGFVFPVYSWGPPPIVEDFISNLKASQAPKYIWMVCTCGDDAGKTPEIVNRALNRSGMELHAAFSVIMPNTYLLLPGFKLDSPNVEKDKLDASKSRIDEISAHILNRDMCIDIVRGKFAGIKSGFIRNRFNRYGINAHKWHSTDQCIGCGICATKCPVQNIIDKKDADTFRPQWLDKCIGCLACYHWCPENAIQYGKRTTGKGQYHFPK